MHVGRAFSRVISFGEPSVPKHIRRLIVLLAVLAALFTAGKLLLPPKSFWVYGHYRAASVDKIAAIHPTFVDSSAFSAAYPKEYATWSAGIHKIVQCQICHMTTRRSPNGGPATVMVAQPGTTALPMPGDSRKLCVKCHQKIAGRPAYMPQIDVASHSHGRQCTSCHNPHSPLFSPAGEAIALANNAGVAGTADVAAGKKLSAACAGCHGPVGVSAIATFPNLACQKRPYLISALTEYQSGKRANPVMGGVAKGLSAADIQNVAAYFAGLSCGQKT